MKALIVEFGSNLKPIKVEIGWYKELGLGFRPITNVAMIESLVQCKSMHRPVVE